MTFWMIIFIWQYNRGLLLVVIMGLSMTNLTTAKLKEKIVDAYIKDKLLNINTRSLASIRYGKTCDPDNLERTVEGQFSTDPRNK